jgi:ubiquinone/menaquinone biosynthesis C-methylase UbiE
MAKEGEIERHYDQTSLVERLQVALTANGLSEKRLSPEDLAPLDQFHSRGLAATVELARGLEIDSSTRVLDIGSGLGGPSRYLAATYGCTVHGVDLSQSFVDAARFLAERSELSDRVSYQRGNALSLPFGAGAFDVAWTQHVAMNIADRAALYGETFRVLRSGGSFAIYDVVAASECPLHYPVPWACGPETSFLVTADTMRAILTEQGFRVVSWADGTDAGVAWFAERESAQARALASFTLGLHVVMGSDFGVMTGNLGRNLREGRVALVQAILQRV